jgi:hypothetical protein
LAVLVAPDAIMIELVPLVPLKARMPVEPTAVQPTGAGEVVAVAFSNVLALLMSSSDAMNAPRDAGAAASAARAAVSQ